VHKYTVYEMIKIAVDKNRKVPLYVQIKERFVYHISTGEIQLSEEMPKLMDLSRELGISYETARRAYQELEREGLISISRGKRTIVSPSGTRKESYLSDVPISNAQLSSAQKSLLLAFVRNQMSLQEIKELIDNQLREIAEEKKGLFVIFCECSQYQTKNISKMLEAELGIRVKPVILKDFDREFQKARGSKQLLAVITTGFHLKEVRDLVADASVDIHALSIHMSAKSRRLLFSYNKKARFGIICRDASSLPVYEDILRGELAEEELNISSCVFSDKNKVNEILASVEVLLVTPPIYSRFRKRVSVGLPVLDMFDQVDRMSLNIIKEQVLGKHPFLLSFPAKKVDDEEY
jgi:GntR family transcriptional regulator